MRGSLRLRLVVVVTAVAVLSVVVTTLAVRQATRGQVQAVFETQVSEEGIDEILTALDGGRLDTVIAEVGDREAQRLFLVDDDGAVVADSAPGEPRPDAGLLVGDVVIEDVDGSELVLYTLSLPEGTSNDLLVALDRRLLLLAGTLVVLAAATGLLVARRLTGPLREVRAAVDRVGAGDTTARVPDHGPGELGELARAVNDMARRQEEAELARQRMTADVAHELRTPIANLRAYVEGMIDGIAEPSGDDLRVVHDETMRLSRLVDDLQLLAVTDAGEVTLDLADHDLGRLVAAVAAATAARAGSDGIRLELQEPTTPVRVRVDADRVQQVVANLVDNAVRHATAGVTVVVHRLEGAPAVDVTDDGPGLAAQDRERVFERLHRVGDARDRASGGAGLGLAIARGLTEAHGGTLTVLDTPGPGATFRVVLPGLTST